MDVRRAKVDAIARTWIGTKFHDHARVKGAGCDCATLLLEVFAEAGMIPPTDVGHYAPQWFLHQEEERYLGWITKFAHEIPQEDVDVGDIVLYRIGKCFAHGAVVASPGWPTIIHASAAARCVRRGDGRNPHLGTPVLGVKFFSLFEAGS